MNMRPKYSSGSGSTNTMEKPFERIEDGPPPPRQASWTNEGQTPESNHSVSRKVHTFFKGAASGASQGIAKVMYSKDTPTSVQFGGEWSSSSLNPFDLTHDKTQDSYASRYDKELRPVSAPTHPRHFAADLIAHRNRAESGTLGTRLNPVSNVHGLLSWMNGIFRSQGIPYQATEVSKSVSDGSTLPTLIEILAGECIPNLVESRVMSPQQKHENIINAIEFLRGKGLALPQSENELTEEVCRGDPSSCAALVRCIKDAYDPNGNSVIRYHNSMMMSSSSLGGSHLPSESFNHSASYLSSNPSMSQNSSIHASALTDSNFTFNKDNNTSSFYGARNSTTLGGGYTTNSSLDMLPGTMLDLTPGINQKGTTNVSRVPSVSCTQMSKMSVEQRKMRLKQNLLTNDFKGKQNVSAPNVLESKLQLSSKSRPSAKPSTSFPSMEEQLKDLLKGNSEESLVEHAHNSTRFHLDYTTAENSGYVPSALENHAHRHRGDADVNGNLQTTTNETSYGVDATASSLDITVNTTLTAPTMTFEESSGDIRQRSIKQSQPMDIQPTSSGHTRENQKKSKRSHRVDDNQFRFEGLDSFGGPRFRGSLGSTGGSSASSLNCLDHQMEEAFRLYPPSPSSVGSSVTPPLPPLSPGDTPPESPNLDRNPPIEIPHYAHPPNGRQSLDNRSSKPSRKNNRAVESSFVHETINKGPPPDLLQGSELKNDRSRNPGSSATRHSSHLLPDRIDLKKILPRPGFEPGDETTADDSSVGGATIDSRLPSNEESAVLRQQLVAMETIYKNVKDLIGSGGKSGGESAGSDDDVRATRLHHKSLKRLARLEGHVVTLARSVAHLSSELRSQHLLCQDIEAIKQTLMEMKSHEIEPEKKLLLSSNERSTSTWVASLANPHRVHKLTKFFGEEPPLLGLFLQKLGYERYLRQFEEEKIGMVELPYISEERLQRLGIPMGPRMRILQEAQGALLTPVEPNDGLNSKKNVWHQNKAVNDPRYNYYFV